eukprot:scaffold200815_cov53-Cyclotella_meneghiniana.AAC.1
MYKPSSLFGSSHAAWLLFWAGLLLLSVTGFCPRPISFANVGVNQCRPSSTLFMNKRGPSFNSCEHANEVLELAVDNISGLPPNQIAAVWSFVSRLMAKPQRRGGQNKAIRKEDHEKLKRQIMTVLKNTRQSTKKMRPKELTTITLGMAKIVKYVRDGEQSRRLNANQQVFCSVFLDDKANLTASIFQPLTKRANDILMEFEPRYLSNLAYAYALLEYDPKLDNGSTLLENIAEASIDVIDQFNAQGISNSVWACAKLEVSHSAFFRAVGDAVVRS